MSEMVEAYLTCALWSSTDPENDDRPFDDVYDVSDVNEEARRIEADCCMVFLDAVEEALGPEIRALVQSEQGGHDFWLSRNGHGAGFFDREDHVYGGQEINDALQEIAKRFGERYPYATEYGVCFE